MAGQHTQRRPSVGARHALGWLAAAALLALALIQSPGAHAAPWRSLTVPAGYISALAASPSQPGVIYASFSQSSTTGGGGHANFARSDDGGQTWVDLAAGVTRTIGWNPGVLAVAPNNPRRVYFAGEGGVYVSVNGGVSWRSANAGLPTFNRQIEHLVVSPSSPNTLYLASRGNGVYRSTNAGLDWTPVNNGLPAERNGTFVQALAVAPNNANVVHVALGQRGELFTTADGGATWTSSYANLGRDANGTPSWRVTALAVAPSNPNRVYAALESYPHRVARSDDGGASWTVGVGDVSREATVLAVDPRNPNIVYAAGMWAGLYSTKDGQNWVADHGGAMPAHKGIDQLALPPWKTPVVYAGGSLELYRIGNPPAGAALKVPAPTVRVAVSGPGLRLTVTASLGTDAKGRTAQIQYQRGKKWIAAARVKVPASGRITRTVALTRAKIGGAKVRRLQVRVVLVKSGANPAAVGTVRSARIPAR